MITLAILIYWIISLLKQTEEEYRRLYEDDEVDI